MKTRCLFAALLTILPLSARASDHADPQSLNIFKQQEAPEANITDLHAFTVDADDRLITDRSPTRPGDALVISICARRALRPDQIGALQLDGYQFRVLFDLDPSVRMFDEKRTRTGADFAQSLIDAKDPAERGRLIREHEADRTAQALYGGVIEKPEAIAADATLSFELSLRGSGETAQAFLTRQQIEGFNGRVHIVDRDSPNASERAPQANRINVEAGVFDDPFIFPRFFRRNVVGIVTRIPMTALSFPHGPGPVLLWATSHQDAKQIDHVGRSLRTQLPRFGELNTLPPAQHVAAIRRKHDSPTLMQDVLSTFISPLIAHRYYDIAPDVMIYDLAKPARFPNGRWLEDDVAKTLADAGETLLYELSYAESRQVPRATTNDKPFREKFPFLAPRWTTDEIKAHAQPGSSIDRFAVPEAPDSNAIATPNLRDRTWLILWLVEAITIGLSLLLVYFAVHSRGLRILTSLVFIVAMIWLWPVRSPNLPGSAPGAAEQPGKKLLRLIEGGGLIPLATLAGAYFIGRRRGTSLREEPVYAPEDRQDGLPEDAAPLSSYQEIHDALFDPKQNLIKYYHVWGASDQRPLPLYRQTFSSLVRHLVNFSGKDYAMLTAARRTLKSRADLRWGGPDRKGFRRLVHPLGVCLVGEWRIDTAPEGVNYTGYFAPGKVGRVIARYSLGGNEPRGGHERSLSLVGKLFPPGDKENEPTPRAHFITQEDLGGTFTDSILDAVLTNSPPVTLLNRGAGVFTFLVVIAALTRADKEPAERQLYEIAELELPAGEKTSCPKYMKLTLDPEKNPRRADPGVDFRDEILGMIYDRGASGPTGRKIVFDISVSDKGRRTVFQKLKNQEWTRIGTITFDRAVASYNGDNVIHFHHPVWRRERNEPGSVAREENQGS